MSDIELPSQESIERKRKETVTILIQNSNGEILLMLRDDKPDVPHPNQWYIPGGGIEVELGESPEEAILREIREEFGIELDMNNVALFEEYKWDDKDEYAFTTSLDLDVSNIELKEGQRIQFFSPDEIQDMDLAFHDNDIVEDFVARSARIEK